MNAIRVSARSRIGRSITLGAFLLAGMRSVRASESVITVKGTTTGVKDQLGIFAPPGTNLPMGLPFTAVFAFDDVIGKPLTPGRCPGATTGIGGEGATSPGIATLTINGKSYKFGERPESQSAVFRTIAKICSQSEIGMNITDGTGNTQYGIHFKLHPADGRTITQEPNWQSPISASKLEGENRDNVFVIGRGGYNITFGYLVVDSVTVSEPRPSTRKPPEPPKPVVQPVAASTPTLPPASAPVGPDISMIYVLTDQGCLLSTFTPDGQKAGPYVSLMGRGVCTGIAIDADGKLLLSRLDGLAEVQSFSPTGTPAPLVIKGQPASALNLDGKGKIFVLRGGAFQPNASVMSYSPDGLPAGLQFETHLNNADGITVDDSGKIYVLSQASQIVKVYDNTGKEIAPLIRTGGNPRAIAIGHEGQLYIANFLSIMTVMTNGQRVNPTITSINPVTGGIDSPMALAVDNRGRLFAGYTSGRIVIFDRDGKQIGPTIRGPRGIQAIALH